MEAQVKKGAIIMDHTSMHECKPLVALLYTPLLFTQNTSTRTEILHLLYSIFMVHNLKNTSDTQSQLRNFIRKRTRRELQYPHIWHA